jgi:hypothetical protein
MDLPAPLAWLVDEAGASPGPDRFLAELGGRLLADGLPLGRDHRPVRLGSRALNFLGTVVERPGELVTKDELIARVWPGIHVQEGNLRVHVAAVRRALGDGQAGIATSSTPLISCSSGVATVSLTTSAEAPG